MNKIPTAEEFIKDIRISRQPAIPSEKTRNIIEKSHIEFAKLHVEAALKAAAEQAREIEIVTGIGCYTEINKETILNAYPLTLII